VGFLIHARLLTLHQTKWLIPPTVHQTKWLIPPTVHQTKWLIPPTVHQIAVIVQFGNCVVSRIDTPLYAGSVGLVQRWVSLDEAYAHYRRHSNRNHSSGLRMAIFRHELGEEGQKVGSKPPLMTSNERIRRYFIYFDRCPRGLPTVR
jgi:hypothetical protein